MAPGAQLLHDFTSFPLINSHCRQLKVDLVQAIQSLDNSFCLFMFEVVSLLPEHSYCVQKRRIVLGALTKVVELF